MSYIVCSMYNVVDIVVVHSGVHVKYLCGITTYKLLLGGGARVEKKK